MNILVWCHEFPPVGGGAGNALYHLARSWVRDGGCSVTVVTSACPGLRSSEQIDGIRVERLSVGRRLLWRATLRQMFCFMVKSVLTGERFYRRERPDICVAFMTMPAGLGPRLIKARHGVPYACQIRGGDVPGFGSSFLERIHRITSSLIIGTWKRSDLLIANSTGLAELVAKTGIGRQVCVIPNGVDTDFFAPGVSPGPQTGGGDLRIVFAGRLVDAQKKVSTICRAIAGLDRVLLTVVGDGPDESLLRQQLRRLNLQGRVRLVGWLDKVALRRAYQEADAYVSASLYEGMSNTALEAMACGLPLILSDIPGHRELLEGQKNGNLFASRDSAALAECLGALRADAPRRRLMAQESRRLACERFSWVSLAGEHLALFQKAVVI